MTLQGNESYVNLKNFGAVASNFAQLVSNMTDSIDRLFRIDVTTDYTQGNSEESETLFK